MTPEEESMFLKFARLYLLTKPSFRFWKMLLNFIIFFIVFWIFMAFSENSFLSSIVSNNNFDWNAIMIWITSIVFYMIYKRIKDVQHYKIVKQNLKEIVMKEYLWEYGKRIISNY
jgi:riboflavin transporter FmnP